MNKSKGRISVVLALGLAVAAIAVAAFAQDFKAFRSTSTRGGMPTLSPSTAVGTVQSVFNNPGRAFLRWWNPVQSIRTSVDNDQTIAAVGSSPGAEAIQSTGSWTAPIVSGLNIFATGGFQATGIAEPYRMIKSVAQTAGTTDPRSGATGRYTFRYSNLEPGRGYRLSLSIPLGPTGTSATTQVPGDFPIRYYVADVVGDPAGVDTQIIDSQTYGGGWVRLGAGGAATDRLYTAPASGVLTVNVYNTIPRNSDGQFIDPDDLPGVNWVYADAARLEATVASRGGYVAQPVVGELAGTTAPTGATAKVRAVGARNETFVSGLLARQSNLATITSYIYNGSVAEASEAARNNVAWSWPVKRPVGTATTEQTRYGAERETWITGPVAGNERHTFRSKQDNTFAQVTTSGVAFAPDTDPAAGAFIGPDYLAAPAIASTNLVDATGEVRFRANVPNGSYRVQVFIPPSSTLAGKATGAQYELFLGATSVRRFTLNQATTSGWVTLPGQPSEGVQQTSATGPLSLRVYNLTSGSAGETVIADGVRWLANADLNVTATPALTTGDIDTGPSTSNRDVVIVPMEDGRIYAIDAVGDSTTGQAPTTYWTYPSNNPATDPNNDPSEDGGVAELPTGFERSSPLVATVGGNDLVFIAGENGRVICLDLEGRGDGTTTRRWSWPDDYDPTDPAGARQAPQKPFLGSVAFGQVSGNDAIFVATQDGQVFALDASGNAASKTTTVLWTATLGVDAIATTPVYEFGRLYINATISGGAGRVFALNTADGTTAATSAEAFTTFGFSSMAAVPGTELVGPGALNGLDVLYVADQAGRVAALNPATLATYWVTTELTGGIGGSIGFAYMTVPNNAGVLTPNQPMVILPSAGGSVVAMFADGTVNRLGGRRAWQINAQTGPVTSVATGGWKTADFRSWMYFGDGGGVFYALNGNDDINIDVITEGEVPGTLEIIENDPGFDDITNLIDPSKFVLLSPEGYEQISAGLLAGTLTPASVSALAAAEDVSRRTFEYGETLYVLVHGLPDLGPGQEYLLESIVATSGAGVRRQIPVRDVSPSVAPGPDSKLWLAALPVLPNVNGSAPGVGSVKVRVNVSGRRSVSQEVDLPYTDSVIIPGGNIRFANPIGIGFPRSDAATGTFASTTGFVTDAYNARAAENGSGGVDAGSAAGPRPETYTGVVPGGFFGPDSAATGDLIPHGAAGNTRMNVFDRSLSFLIFGPGRGLPNVRMAGGDLAWQIRGPGGAPVPSLNVYRPLSDNGVAYPGFEELPSSPNQSLDYPDIERSALAAARTRTSRVENPMFNTVSLVPASVTDPQLNAYRTAAGFDGQLDERILNATPFDLTLNVPRYQPASGPAGAPLANRMGYRGLSFVFVDVGDQTPGFNENDANRAVSLGVRIAPDERIRVGSPALDLGSVPGGAGFNGGAPLTGGVRGAINPLNAASVFRPNNPEFANQFTQYSLFNEGNVNLLSVRLSRGVESPGASLRNFVPSKIQGQGMPQNVWLNSATALLTDLDAQFAPTRAVDAQGRVFIQKPRPGDAVSSRLSTNPVRRANGNLGVNSGSLLDPGLFPTGDPKVAPVVQLGTPTGQYRGTIYPIEDSGAGNDASGLNPGGVVPVLGSRDGLPLVVSNWEPFAEPGLTISFNVRELRLTNRPTQKGPAAIEAAPFATEGMLWDNAQPTGVRTATGDLMLAWASNRLDVSGNPAFNSAPRNAGDAARDNSWRVYVSVANADTSAESFVDSSPLSAHTRFTPSSGGTLFAPLVTLPDAVSASPAALFRVPTGWTIEPASVNFGSPVMDANAGRTNAGLAAQNYVVGFLGTAMVRDDNGNRREISNIFAVNLNSSGPTPFPHGNPVMVYGEDAFSKKTGLAIVQTGTAFSILYTAQSGNGSQLVGFNYASGAANRHGSTYALNSSAFDRISAPSAQVRGSRGGGASVEAIDLVFSARRLGKTNAEAFMGRLGSNAINIPSFLSASLQNFYRNREDELVRDSNGVFWAPGVSWRTDDASLAAIDLARERAGVRTSILVPGSGNFDPDSGLLSYDITLGGKVSMNTKTGLIQFSGAVFPAGSRLVLTFSPTYISVGSAKDANYRTVRTHFDQNLLPAPTTMGSGPDVERENLAYVYDEGHTPIPNHSSIRNDRLVLAMSRTTTDGSQAAKGYMSSIRFGIRLPTAVLVNGVSGAAYGTILSGDFQVGFTAGPSGAFSGAETIPAGFRVYQVDPIAGRMYFQSEAEGRKVSVRYRGIDASGRDLGLITVEGTVQLITEQEEEPIPMEQPANESGFFLIGDIFANTTLPAGFSQVFPPTRYWMVWTSTRTGNMDIYLQTVAPRFYAKPPAP